MYNIAYSEVCNHERLERIDDNFVRCLQCGLSMVSQKQILSNKNRREFTKENKNFSSNYDRNFTNILGEIDNNKPIYEYYTDKLNANKIIVNKQIQFFSNPAKYEVMVNDTKHYLTDGEIRKLLKDINAIHIGQNLPK